MSKHSWSGIDQRHIAALEAVAKGGSFRAAAESLGYVQSAVSDQISQLEGSVGMQLVERRRGAASGALTAAGAVLLRHFEAITAEMAAARADIDKLRGGGPSVLRVGAFESASERLLPGILSAFQRLEPDIAVEIVESSGGEELGGLVLGGKTDVALGCLPAVEGPLRWRRLLCDRYVLLVPGDWPMARAAELATLQQIAGLPLIGHADSPASRLLEAELRAAGVEPRFLLRSKFDGAIRAMVEAGLGAALVPHLAAGQPDGRTVTLELEQRLSPRTVVALWRADRDGAPGLERFVELAADRARTLAQGERSAARRLESAGPQPATVTRIGREAPLTNG